MVEGNMVAVLDAVGDAVVAVDREWRITYLNAAAVRWFRSEAADLLHRSIWSAFPDLAQARLFEKLHRAVAEQAATTDETYDPAHDSWSLIRAQPFADGLLIFASDVTDQKRREDRIAKLQALTAALSVVLGRDEVADVIVDHTRAMMGANLVALAALSEDRREFITLKLVGYPDEDIQRLGRVPADAPMIFADVVRRGEPIFIETWSERIARYPHFAKTPIIGGYGASASLPLMIDARPIGALGFSFPTDRGFDAEERDFLRAITDLCAQALERSRLYEAERAARAAAETVEDELRLQAGLLDQAYNANFAWDWDGGIVFWNRGAERLYGYGRDDAIGRVSHEILRAEHPDGFDTVRATLERDGQWAGEVAHTRRDGTRILVESRLQLVTEGGRRVVLEANRDITERRRAEEERERLLAQEQAALALLDTLFAGSPNGFAFFDTDLRFQRVNHALAAMNGAPAEAHIGRTLLDIVPEMAASQEPNLRHVLDTGEPMLDLEASGETAAVPGELRHWLVSYYPVRGAGGQLLGVGASAVEITERKRFEERLRQSEERLRIALGGSPIVVYQQDRDLRYTWLYNSLTAPIEQVLGKTDAQLLPIDEAAALIAIKRRVLETGVVERAEIRATPSQKTSYFDLTVEPMRDESGAIVGVTGSGVDISDRKEREERIAKLQELTAALASAVDADAVARAIVDHGVDAVGANLGIVAVLSGDGQTLVTRAAVGLDADTAEIRRRIPIDDPTAITDAVRRREPIYLESWQERIGRYPSAAAYHAVGGDGAAVTLPLLVEGKPIGALGFGFPTDRVFDGEARDFLRALADLCSQALERARLYDAERQARDAAQEAERRLALLVEISDHLAASLDYEDTVARVARLVVPALADWCAVNLGSPGDAPQLVALAAADPAEEARLKAFAVEAPVPSGAEGGVAQVLRTGQAVFLPTVLPSDAADTGDPEAGARSRTLDLSSYLCVPLIARGRVRGSLTFAMSWSGRHYREDDLALAEEIARRAAAAIDNAGLFQAAQQEIAERELATARTARLQEVTAALSEAVTIHQVVDVVLERAVPAVGAQGGTVNLLTPTGDAFEIAGSAGMPHRLVEGWRRYPVVGPFPLSDAAKTAEPVWIEQPDDWLTRYPESFDDFMASGFHALASVPLTIEGRLIGGLGYDFTQPRRFTPDDRAFIIALSQQVAQALDRARLYEAEREARSGAQAAEARYRGLFERSADAVLVVDQQGRFQDANPAALELLRYDLDELRGLTLAELAGRDTSWVESVFDNLAREGTWHRELDLRRKDGELVPIEARATAIQTPAGAAAMIAARDISSRRLLERMQQDFFASISHDLKNPLAALRGQVQLLQRRLSRKGILEVSEAESGLETIQNVGERMTGMIEELVDVAQLRGGNPLRLRRQPTDLVAIAARRVREHQQATTRHRIEFDAAEATFSGWWDEARLGRVIDNLLTNAVKYSLGGVISVRLVRDARADGDWVVMTVADNGVGIPSADLPRIFERFRRGSNVLDRFAGTGLGLSGVREIVVQHGGDVSIASAEGVGTTVTVSLPMGEPRDAEI